MARDAKYWPDLATSNRLVETLLDALSTKDLKALSVMLDQSDSKFSDAINSRILLRDPQAFISMLYHEHKSE